MHTKTFRIIISISILILLVLIFLSFKYSKPGPQGIPGDPTGRALFDITKLDDNQVIPVYITDNKGKYLFVHDKNSNNHPTFQDLNKWLDAENNHELSDIAPYITWYYQNNKPLANTAFRYKESDKLGQASVLAWDQNESTPALALKNLSYTDPKSMTFTTNKRNQIKVLDYQKPWPGTSVGVKIPIGKCFGNSSDIFVDCDSTEADGYVVVPAYPILNTKI